MAQQETASGQIFDRKVLAGIFQFVKPYIGRFYLLIVLTVLMGLLSPLRPYLIQYTIDHHIAHNDMGGLVRMVWLMIGLALVQALVQFSNSYLSDWVGQHVIRDIRITLFKHLLSLKTQYFDRTPIGRLVTRNISDVETLNNVFTEGLAAIVGDLLQLLFILGLMLYTDWRLTLVSLSTFPLLFVATYIFKEKIKKAFNSVRVAVANLNSFVQEHITGMSIVQIFSSEQREFERFKEINREHRKAHLKSVKYYSIYFPVAEVIGAIATGMLVWYGAKGVIQEHLTLGTLVAFIMYISMFFRPIRLIADRFNTLQMGIVSGDRLMKILNSREQIQNTGTYRPASIRGDVTFENVWFAYNDEDYVLKNINFEAHRGQTVALVGATGAGKSSTINLISRFYDVNQGRILFDGVDIREYELYFLRRRIGIVLQDVFLFSGSIMDNITLGNEEITLEQVQKAAELVGALSFIERLPGGFDYNVMERGATLSVGQRQLISFVRAMVYNPDIIILDEATSSVDSETEKMIQDAIGKMMKGRTAIIIAHRLATIQNADRIIVLDKGEIKEMGKHDELLALGGYYARLHKMQYKEMAA
ncbi:ABC transporter ATP-binding protein [Rhodoflexus caldus]|uniref:ABC transporter ATP-binding protein n=1 Tax=Rhodoflexus caldus TaxID=2891236 RepID=UPI00202AAAEB|nr:ABC transporter ATP-binding protein [Rhodoflexus caldus]